jgi:protein-S-isoprenylcysteine O-methyltransferase Ste14
MRPAEQPASTDNMKIHTVQAIRKVVFFVAAALGIFVVAVTSSIAPSGSTTHELVEWIGVVFIVICILGRTWSSLYIGGRKIEELVQTGPYSVMRNPLYFFSCIGAVGVGMQVGTVTLGLLTGLLAYVVFYVVVQREEELLTERYGAVFEAYKARVPRFFPNPWLWQDEPTLTIRPPRVLTTFGDALVFLLAVPIAEVFEYFQDTGAIPVLLRLP